MVLMRIASRYVRLLAIAAGALLSGCAGSGGSGSGPVTLNAAGATFPAPMYSKWFDEYHKVKPGVQFNYQPIGSGGGIRQLQNGTIDFGASDQPMTDEQLAQSPKKVLHFPTVLGAVVPTYNIPNVTAELNFTPEALAGIMLGTVGKWNAPEIAKANPGVALPAADIIVVHRSDGSGTTFIWTDYLSKVSPEWKSKVGSGTSVNWPLGLGGKGNDGVAGLVKQTPNALGYVELIYAVQNKMAYGKVRNAAGNFVKAELAGVTAAAASVADSMPADFRVSITNAPGPGAWPISSFTWLLIPSQIQDPAKRDAVKGFLTWALGPGQDATRSLTYAPLPAQVAGRVRELVSQIQ